VHTEQLVVGLGVEQAVLGCGQLRPNEERFHPPGQEEQECRYQVAGADLLVIDSDERGQRLGTRLPDLLQQFDVGDGCHRC